MYCIYTCFLFVLLRRKNFPFHLAPLYIFPLQICPLCVLDTKPKLRSGKRRGPVKQFKSLIPWQNRNTKTKIDYDMNQKCFLFNAYVCGRKGHCKWMESTANVLRLLLHTFPVWFDLTLVFFFAPPFTPPNQPPCSTHQLSAWLLS